MDHIRKMFDRYPSQGRVAEVMLRYGICEKNGKAFCGDVEIADSALARSAGVDRRVVRSTLERMSSTSELDAVFSKLRPILMLDRIASEIDCSVIEIVPSDATMPGILADVASVIYSAGLSVRQAVVDDNGERKDSQLIIVVDGQIPAELIPLLRKCRGVSGINIR
ncbi:MAG: regulator of amino acid metabolism, contains ACT domain protein [Candidatus Methanomethylophilaceae archaeon]|nr:regulator of amino acid metabolism, contains ACT domain protein [Candidatus Methanomethylophilaceae archaeon]